MITASSRIRSSVTFAKDIDAGSSCVFDNIFDRMPVVAKTFVDRMMPGDDWSTSDKEDAFCCISEWLMDNRDWVFPENAKCWCNIHKQECPVFFGDAVWSVLDPEDEIEDSDSFSSEVRPLSIALAGVTCKAWSAAGAQFRIPAKPLSQLGSQSAGSELNGCKKTLPS